MKNKNVFKLSAIILIVIGVVLISLSFIVSDKKEMDNNKTNNDDSNVEVKPSEPEDERPPLTYNEVYDMAVSLYGGDGITIEVVEEGDRFIINCVYDSTGNVMHYFVDKETGSIAADEIVDSNVSGG